MNGTYGTTATSNALQVTGSRFVDDFLRRELRVGDPRNALEVVTALRKRYSADAARLDQEIAGLPVRYDLQAAPLPVLPAAGDTPATKEERRVLMNLESDLTALIDSRDNREWTTEIRGWRDTLLREFVEGTAAARLAQDPAMRDRGFLSVRKLGEYARVARLVGVVNLPLNCDYRRLATTLDDAANVIRILMGEALFNAGLAEGGLIIQVPLFELRDRRDALVFAVRRLSGTSIDTENDDWGDALAAYRELLAELQRRGAPELRVYLRPDLLAAIVDGLVGEIARQDPDGLRQIAATSPVEIARMRRLFEVANLLLAATPPQAAITAALSLFVRALQLFLDGFADDQAGSRLIDLAMPLPLAAQQADEPDREGRRILRELVSLRGEYAREVECFLSCCGCDRGELRCQVQLDKLLYDVDRAIDLYAHGSGIPPDFGVDEQRAAVYGLIARNLAAERGSVTPVAAFEMLREAARCALDLLEALNELSNSAVRTSIIAFARTAVIAAEAGAASRTVEEGIRRALFDVPANIAAAVGLATDLLGDIATTARDTPLGIEEAILVLIDVIEVAVGVTTAAINTTPAVPPGPAISIANVGRHLNLATDTGFDNVGVGLLALGVLNQNETIARNVLVQARFAIRASLRAMNDGAPQATRTDAEQVARDLHDEINVAVNALTQGGPLDPDRDVLRAAIEAGTVAEALALRVARRPATEQFEPIALGRLVLSIHQVLVTALPADTSVIDSVFDEQLRCEQDWQTLVRSLAPRCLGPGQTDLALAGLDLLRASPRRRSRIDVATPFFPHERVSLASIAGNVNRAARFAGSVAASAGNLRRSLGSVAAGLRPAQPGGQPRAPRRAPGQPPGGTTVPGGSTPPPGGPSSPAASGSPNPTGPATGPGGGALVVARTAAATRETTEFIRDALAAARDVTAEAVRFAEDTNLIERVRDQLLDELDERRDRLGAYAPGQSAQAARRPSVGQFAMRLYSCRTRGEIRALIDQDPTLLQDWDDIKIAYGDDLDDEFVASIEDSLDPSKKTRLNRKQLEEACRQAVYPLRLGR